MSFLLNKVNLSLDQGEFVVITGESGSGKSTLLNVISGLDSYEEGELYINGTRVNDTNEFGIDSFEIFNKHVIVSYGSSNGGFITIYDTNNLDKPYHVELKDYYSPILKNIKYSDFI